MRGLIAVGVMSLLAAAPAAAQQRVQVFLSLRDAEGKPPVSLTADDLQITEGGDAKYVLRIVDIERIEWPVKVHVLVDNGLGMDTEGLHHIRTGLRGLLEALPEGVEVAIYTTAPQPRPFARATTDRDVLRKSVDRLVRDTGIGRLLEALSETAQRIERDRSSHFPVVVSISTTAGDTRVQPGDLEQTMRRLKALGIVVHMTMLQPVLRDGRLAGVNQSQLGLAIRELTGGRFESLATPTRLATLLPEIGQQVAASHRRQSPQFRVTVERPATAASPGGPLTASIRRGYSGVLTLDGVIP